MPSNVEGPVALNCLAACVLSTCITTRVADASDRKLFALRDGDRVVFYGDSITEQRFYTTAIETFVLTRFPSWKVEFIESGWGGDTASGGGGGAVGLRLQRDVLDHHPSMVCVMLGMNDGYYYKADADIEQLYRNGLELIASTIASAEPDCRLTLLQTTPYDNVTRPSADSWEKVIEGGYNSVLAGYGQHVAAVAARHGAFTSNVNAAFVDVLKRAMKLDPELATQLIPDRIHPSRAGSLVTAACVLEAWNAPAMVTEVELDATAGALVHAAGTRVSDLECAQSIHWTQVDEALPFPISPGDKVTDLVAQATDFSNRFNRQLLRITGLAPKEYELRINDTAVGVFTAEDLSAGVNLGAIDTPMMRQAAEVHALTLKRSDLAFARWRHVQLAFSELAPEITNLTVKSMIDLETACIARQRSAAVPRARYYRVRAVEPSTDARVDDPQPATEQPTSERVMP